MVQTSLEKYDPWKTVFIVILLIFTGVLGFFVYCYIEKKYIFEYNRKNYPASSNIMIIEGLQEN